MRLALLASMLLLFATGCPRAQEPAPPDARPQAPATRPAEPPRTEQPAETPPGEAPEEGACASSEQCGEGQRCTTEDGVCLRPPGCGPEDICPMVCYGVCVDRPAEGAAAPPPAEPAAVAPARCKADADCVTFSDYCTGCDCRALGKAQAAPGCSGPGVRCLRDPCADATARCKGGICAVVMKD